MQMEPHSNFNWYRSTGDHLRNMNSQWIFAELTSSSIPFLLLICNDNPCRIFLSLSRERPILLSELELLRGQFAIDDIDKYIDKNNCNLNSALLIMNLEKLLVKMEHYLKIEWSEKWKAVKANMMRTLQIELRNICVPT